MRQAVAVTGFAPIEGHPRSPQEYKEYAKQLSNTGIPLKVKRCQVRNTWLHWYLYDEWSAGRKIYTHSVADNPEKNSVEYHCVQAQKTRWLAMVRKNDPADVFVWIDYGIFHLPGVTANIIREFMERAREERGIAIPGCWGPDYVYDDQTPCWRFCGGLMVVASEYVRALDDAMNKEYKRHLKETGNLSWEVNTLSRLERRGELPIRQYMADHNATMFTNYR